MQGVRGEVLFFLPFQCWLDLARQGRCKVHGARCEAPCHLTVGWIAQGKAGAKCKVHDARYPALSLLAGLGRVRQVQDVRCKMQGALLSHC